MTSRLSDDDLDVQWQDGLRAAVPFVDMRHAPERVASRIRRRRRRRAGTALIATLTTLMAAVGVVLALRGNGSPAIHTAGRVPRDVTIATVQLRVTSEPSLSLHLDRVIVPAGVIEIVYLDGGGSHELRIDRVPGFRLRVPLGPTIGRVRLEPGRYVLYCDIPGHREAGEQAILTVEPPAPAPTVTGHSSTADTWAKVVGPYLPSGATLVPLPPPASTVLGANPSSTILTYKLPSGRYVVAARMRATLDPERAGVIPGKDVDDRTAQGSRRFVITHNAAAWTQVIIQRPNGTLLNLRIDSDPRVTFAQPAELDANGLTRMGDALDNQNSDL